jgi:SAM-dependent methyltransferase
VQVPRPRPSRAAQASSSEARNSDDASSGAPPAESAPRFERGSTSSSAIQAMRIIAIGASPSAAEPEVPEELTDDDVAAGIDELPDESEGEPERYVAEAPATSAETPQPEEVPAAPAEARVEPPSVESAPGPPAPAAEEFAATEDAVATDDAATARDDAVSLPPDEVSDALDSAPPVSDADAVLQKPPPPVRRPAPPSPTSKRVRGRKRERAPWWEEIFTDDFQRASIRLTDAQVSSEVDFIERSLGVSRGGAVLDLACGAGYHAVELATRGYGVVGFDLSVHQLALASDVAQGRGQKINLLQGDMRDMAFEEMFDGAFCWNTSFGYFEEEKNFNVAERVFKSLRPGGMFLLDVANRDFAAHQSPSQVWFEGDSCVCMDDMSVDFITSRLRVKRSIILDDGTTRECQYSLRLYSLHELGKLLHAVGFRVTEASGHPTTPGVFFGQHSPRIIVLAQRP